MTWLWVALAGGVGAVLRHLVHVAMIARGTPSSLATVTVNAVGSFLAGLVAATVGRWLPHDLAGVLAVGLLGGFTTFSTASVESVKLLVDPTVQRVTSLPRPAAAASLAVGMFVVSVGSAALGWWLGSAP